MRIGIVCPYAMDVPGGVQNQVLGLAAWLHRAGHNAFVLAPGLVDGHRSLHGLPPTQITSLGRTIAFSFNRSVARVTMAPRVGADVKRWLHAAQLDVLNVHEPLVPLTSWAALSLGEVPTVGTFHASGANPRIVRLASAVVRRPLRRLATATAVSATAAGGVYDALGVDTQIVPNGLFLSDFASATTVGWRGGGGPRVTFFGRLDEPRKGLSVFVDAATILRESWRNAVFTVGGGGRASLPSWMESTGTMPDVDRNRLLANTDVFVAPQTGRESFGLVLVEALAAGAAVVASDLPAFRDVLTRDGRVVGSLFRPADPADLTASIDAMLRRGPAPTQGEGLDRARDFDWDRVGPRYLRIFAQSAVGGPCGPIA